MGAADIRQSAPYFRVKRDRLTLFIGARANDSIHAVKLKVLTALEEHGSDSAFTGLTAKCIRILARHDDATATSTSSSYRVLEPDSTRIKDVDIADDQTLYLTLQCTGGTWEEPFVADYDADTQDMDTT
ncbi:hypothetical protein GGI20_000681 [Coemansia sp. BCRC 34301]|nr:hypothetical protein GGI20_000681 [Coemansia sp. BCRC 34301]